MSRSGDLWFNHLSFVPLQHCECDKPSSTVSALTSQQVGIKPTPGLTSRHGVIPASSTYDTVGPMAGDVKTCATILQVIAGKDAKDNLTSGIPFDAVPDYINACKTDALQGVRIGALAFMQFVYQLMRETGVPTAYLEAKIKRGKSELKSLGLEHYKSMIPVLRELGAVVIENVDFPELERCHKELDHVRMLFRWPLLGP